MSRDEKFVEAIARIEQPTNLAELQSFLGLANYASRFVPNYAAICKPLNVLRKKNIKWEWLESQETAFRTLKSHLMTSPKLFLFEDGLDTILFCDASKHTIAGVLAQYKDELRIIGYYSKTLTETQSKYNIYTTALLNENSKFLVTFLFFSINFLIYRNDFSSRA